MAWAEQRAPKQWRGLYRDRDGTKHRVPGTFTTKTAARDAATAAEVAAQSTATMLRKQKMPTWGEWCERWWKARAIEPATHATESGMVRVHIAPEWGRVRLDEINKMDVQRWVNSLNLATESRRRVLGVFVSSLSSAVEQELISSNPATSIKLPPRAQGREVFLTKEQFGALVNEIPNRNDRAIVKMLAGTGMRWGELAGLHWNNVDLHRLIVTVRDVSSAGEIKPYPKGRRQRHVPIFEWGIEDIDLTAPRSTCKVHHREGVCESGLVFHTANGGAIDHRNFSKRVLKPALKRAGLEHLGATLHDLRHTYASWLAGAGIPLARIGELLGHASVTTTQIYAHLQPARHDDLAAAIGGDQMGALWGQNGGKVTHLRANSHAFRNSTTDHHDDKTPDRVANFSALRLNAIS